MPPLPGSPAIDAAIGSTDTVDQRGFPRPRGAAPDLGAVEGNFVTSAADSGAGTLRQAILSAVPGDYINFALGMSGQTILLPSGEFFFTNSLTIDASGLSGSLILSGNHVSRIFHPQPGSSVNLINLELIAGTAGPVDGGAIRSLGALSLVGCTLSGNTARDGGAIASQGPLTVRRCTFFGNTANRYGGAIANSTPMNLTHCTISGNNAFDGGGIKQFNVNFTMNYSIVAGNTLADLTTPDNVLLSSFSGTANITSGNPLLAPLGNYGGPTQTSPPLPGSPAIDAALNSMDTTDQRGFQIADTPDIGATEGGSFEFTGQSLFPVSTLLQAPFVHSAFDGTNFLLGFQFPGASGSVGAQLISPTGALIGSQIAVASYGDPPLVAFDGNNYLLLWKDYAGVNWMVDGQFVNKAGASVGAPFPISTSTTVYQLEGAAFDGTNYLAVWTDDRRGAGAGQTDIYGQLVSKAGAQVGAEFKISGVSGFGAGVAFDGTNYLVAWIDNVTGTEVRGLLINRFGAAVGSELVIDANANPSNASAPGVFFDGSKYVVAFVDQVGTNFATTDLFARLVTTAGTVLTNRVTLSSAPGGQLDPQIAFDGTNHLVTWNDGLGGTNVNIKGKFFDATWTPVSSEFILFGAQGDLVPANAPVLFNGQKYLVVTGLGHFDTNALYFTNPSGGLALGRFVEPIPHGAFSIAINGAFGNGAAGNGSNFVVGLQAGTNVGFQLISTNGILTGPMINIGSNPKIRGYPLVKYGTTNYLAVWADDFIGTGVDIFGQIISAAGNKVGSAFNLLQNQGTHGFQRVQASAFDGTNYMVAWQDKDSGAFYGQLVNQAGTLSGSEFLISNQAGNGNSAAMAFDGTNYFLAWQSNNGNSSGNNLKTYGAFVSRSGTVGGLLQISQTTFPTSPEKNPLAVAFDGTNYLVVWNKNIGPDYPAIPTWILCGRLVSRNGAFAGNELVLATDQPLFPSLAFDGANFLLAYSYNLDTTNSDKTVRYRFLNRSGIPVGSEFTLFPPQGTSTPLFGGVGFDGSRFLVITTLGTVGVSSTGDITIISNGTVYGLFLDPAVFTDVLANVSAPTIITQPRDQAVAVGDAIELSVGAVGTEPLTYQWQLNGANLNGATGASLVINNAQASASGDYTVTVSNYLGSSVSAVATIDVLSAPFISVPPAGRTASPGDNVTFSVTSTGSPSLRYQWRLNGANLLNATNATLSLANVQVTDAGVYSVVVANEVGAEVSSVAKLLVGTGPLVLTDNFNARAISNHVSGSVQGNSVSATKEAGEPNHAGNAGGKSVWFAWTAPGTGPVTFNTVGSGFDTLLAVYTGTSVTNLAGLVSNDDQGGFFTSAATFFATNGVTYQIAVDGFGGTSGDVVLNWQWVASPNDVPRFATQPQNQTVTNGANAQFTVKVAVSDEVNTRPALLYQWYYQGQLVSGATATNLVVANVQPAQVGTYQLVVLNTLSGQSFFSDPATLEIGSAPDRSSADKFESLFAGSVPGVPSPPARPNVVTVSAGTLGTQIFDNFGATTELGEPTICGVIGGASRWFSIQATDNGLMEVDTLGSDFDTVLGVYTGTSLLSLNLVACDNNSAPDGLRSVVTFTAVKGTTYLVAVDGVNAAQGHIALNWRLGIPPAIQQPPASQVVTGGGQVTLSVSATGTPTPAYQWRFNGVEIFGATNTTLTLTNFQEADRGSYSVVAVNLVGSAPSASAFLALDAPAHLGSLIRPTNGVFQFRLTGIERQNYIIQFTTNILSANTVWTPISTNSAFNGLLIFNDDAGTNARRFYRAIKQ